MRLRLEVRDGQRRRPQPGSSRRSAGLSSVGSWQHSCPLCLLDLGMKAGQFQLLVPPVTVWEASLGMKMGESEQLTLRESVGILNQRIKTTLKALAPGNGMIDYSDGPSIEKNY